MQAEIINAKIRDSAMAYLFQDFRVVLHYLLF